MRVEPYSVGSFMHVVRRGAKGHPVFSDESGRFRFLQMLAHFNDSNSYDNWHRDLEAEAKHIGFERAQTWKPKDPLVKIHAFVSHVNHFHLLLEEIREGGMSLFMKKLGNGIAAYCHERYGEFGSPFQSSYKSKTVHDDFYFRYLFAYICVKNVFELHPKGYSWAQDHFNDAYAFALRHPDSSLFDFHKTAEGGVMERGIVSDDFFRQLFSPEEFKRFAEDVIDGREHLNKGEDKLIRGYFG